MPRASANPGANPAPKVAANDRPALREVRFAAGEAPEPVPSGIAALLSLLVDLWVEEAQSGTPPGDSLTTAPAPAQDGGEEAGPPGVGAPRRPLTHNVTLARVGSPESRPGPRARQPEGA